MIVDFFKRNIIFVLGPIFSRLTTFFVLPLYTSVLTTAQYGRLELILTIGVFFKGIVSMSTTTSFWKFTSDYEDQYNQVVFNLSLIPIIIGLGLSILLLPFFYMIDLDYINLILLYCFSELIMAMYNVSILVLRDKYLGKFFFILNFTYVILFVVLSFFLLNFLELSIFGVVITYLISSVIVFLAAYLIVIKNYVQYKLNIKMIKDIIRYSFPLTLSNVSFLILSFSDRFLISGILGDIELGKYSYVRRIGSLIKVAIVDSFFTVWNPLRWKIYKNSKGILIFKNMIYYFRLMILYVTIPLYFIIIQVGSMLTNNTDLTNNLKLLLLIALGYLYFGMYYLNISGLLFKEKTKLITYIVVFVSVINIFLNYYFIEYLGIYGSCLIFACSFILMSMLAGIISNRFYNIRLLLFSEFIHLFNTIYQLVLSCLYIKGYVELNQVLIFYFLIILLNLIYTKFSNEEIDYKILFNVFKIR